MRFKALVYELEILNFERVYSPARFKWNMWKKVRKQTRSRGYRFEDVLLVMCRSHLGYPGLGFDELQERAGREVFWELWVARIIILRAFQRCRGIEQAKLEVKDEARWARLERIRKRMTMRESASMADQQEKMHLMYCRYTQQRFATEDVGLDWAAELARAPQDGAWTAMTLAVVYAPPCKLREYREASAEAMETPSQPIQRSQSATYVSKLGPLIPP
ncbi:hypothetical protein DIPPA_04347 [Diplonema papillatum]|nr:hypothetical protein DIPPA_04347 [Diplonema papillatum]